MIIPSQVDLLPLERRGSASVSSETACPPSRTAATVRSREAGSGEGGNRPRQGKEGRPHGRPKTAGKLQGEMQQLKNDGLSNRQIAKKLNVSRTSVVRLLRPKRKA